MVPVGDGAGTGGVVPPSGPDPIAGSDIVTGSNSAVGATAAATGSPNLPRWYNRRQLKTWLAFTPCSRATRATEVLGSKVASTIRLFSAIE
jgi:hypothetical protein